LFDLVLHMSGLGSFDEEFEHAIRIDVEGVEVPVLAIDRIIVSKEAANREKDRLVLPVLRDTALTLQALKHGRKRTRKQKK